MMVKNIGGSLIFLLCSGIFDTVVPDYFIATQTEEKYEFAASICPFGFELAILDTENATMEAINTLVLEDISGKLWFSLDFVNQTYQWHNGVPMGNWTFWQDNQPDDPVDDKKHCVVMEEGKDFKWKHYDCSKDEAALCYGHAVTTAPTGLTTSVAELSTTPATLMPSTGVILQGFVKTHTDERFTDDYPSLVSRSKLVCAGHCVSTEGCFAFMFSKTGVCYIVVHNPIDTLNKTPALGISIWERL
ncbi:hypothetical protein ScPMuIL_014039 [Solemya velum]